MTKQTGLIIYYRLNDMSQREKTNFCRKFLGFKDKSTFGKYTYQRDGFISHIPNIRISSSLFIIQKKHYKEIDEFFKTHKVNLLVREIILEETDKEQLGLV
jgi:hypothetical protein